MPTGIDGGNNLQRVVGDMLTQFLKTPKIMINSTFVERS